MERRRRGDPPRVECDGATLDVDPVRAYEHDRLRFVAADLAHVRLQPAAVVRCCNMLLYFDRVFRREALAQLERMLLPNGILVTGTDWAFTTESRYFTCRKRNGGLAEGEFNFSLDNVVPLGTDCRCASTASVILPWPQQSSEMPGSPRGRRRQSGSRRRWSTTSSSTGSAWQVST